MRVRENKRIHSFLLNPSLLSPTATVLNKTKDLSCQVGSWFLKGDINPLHLSLRLGSPIRVSDFGSTKSETYNRRPIIGDHNWRGLSGYVSGFGLRLWSKLKIQNWWINVKLEKPKPENALRLGSPIRSLILLTKQTKSETPIGDPNRRP